MMPGRYLRSWAPIACSAVAFVGCLIRIQLATAGDWPQIMGPNRDGIAVGEKISAKWPNDQPRTVWQRDVGSGFAGVAVADGKAFLFHRQGKNEVLEAMNAKTGEIHWKSTAVATYVPSFINDNGPRAVPTVYKGRVISYGARGHLRCLDAKTGKQHWSHQTFDEFTIRRAGSEPAEGFFGVGNGPIVEAGNVVVNVGGAEGAGIVAFNLETGKVAWKSTDDRASYSSPIAATVNDVRHLIFATRFNVVSLDPETGKERFRFDFGRPGPNVTAANPVVIDGKLFITASYGFGAVFASIGNTGVDELWRNDDLLSSQYTTSIVQGELLFGIHGRQDAGSATLLCLNPKTRKVIWSEEDFGYATIIKAGDKLLLTKTNGEVVVAENSTTGYRPLAKAQLFDSTTRALPALSNGLLYLRDDSTLKCFDLGPE